MYSIKSKVTCEITINKSRFIGVATPVDSENAIKEFLENIRKEYPNATHYTYAYVLGDQGIVQKASDDGEPTRTAGYPILDVLLKNELTWILLVVIRYYGGIKLGAGGLIRAYSKAASDAINHASLASKTTTYKCTLRTDYDHLGSIDRYIRENTELLDVAYDLTITFTFQINAKSLDIVREDLFQKNNFEDQLEIVDEFSEYA
ncbi:MAG TPA: YigZ family protein [Bacillota bacterium]|nr:YigZ family protein [Bacillota bacterium]